MDPQSLPQSPVAQPTIFALLMPSKLSSLAPISNDAVGETMRILIESSPVDFTMDAAIDVCEQALALLGTTHPKPIAADLVKKGKVDRDADAYDGYFSVVRVDENERQFFAQSLLVAFREMLVDAKQGCSLSPMEWGVIRQGFIELCRLITSEEYLY